MALNTKTKLCLASAAMAAGGLAVGAYFGNQPASDASAMTPMLVGFAVAVAGVIGSLILAPWASFKGATQGWKSTDGPSQESDYERNRRLFDYGPGMVGHGVPGPGNAGHPLWETYYGPPAGELARQRDR